MTWYNPPLRTEAGAEEEISLWYHGTDASNLQSILSQGLIPFDDPKDRNWGKDQRANFHNTSQESVPGSIYLTQSLSKANSYGSNDTSFNRGEESSPRGNSLLVIVQAQPRTFLLDDDDLRSSISEPLPPNITDNTFWVSLIYQHKELGTNPSWLDEFRSEFLERAKRRIFLFLDKSKELHPLFIERLDFLLSDMWEKSLERKASHIFALGERESVDVFDYPYYVAEFLGMSEDEIDGREWLEGITDGERENYGKWIVDNDKKFNYYKNEWRRAFEDIKGRIDPGGEIDLSDTEPPSPPDADKAEEDFINARNQLTLTLKNMARPIMKIDQFNNTARLEEPIGYSGANKIVSIIEDGGDDIVVHYGMPPQEFIKDWEQTVGPWREDNVSYPNQKEPMASMKRLLHKTSQSYNMTFDEVWTIINGEDSEARRQLLSELYPEFRSGHYTNNPQNSYEESIINELEGNSWSSQLPVEIRENDLRFRHRFKVNDSRNWGKNLPQQVDEEYPVSDVYQSQHVDTVQFQNWFGESQVVREDGTPKVVYRGDVRADKLESLNPNKALASRFYFTENTQVADGYTEKVDEKHNDERYEYEEWFKFKPPKGSRVRRNLNLFEMWHYLTPEQQEKVKQIVLGAQYDLDSGGWTFGGKGKVDDDRFQLANGFSDWKKPNQNWLQVANDAFIVSGSLYGEEKQFMKLLQAAGLDPIYDSPYLTSPGITPVYLSIQNPLDTSNIPIEVVDSLRMLARKDRSRSKNRQNQWDKNTMTPKEFMVTLEKDLEPEKGKRTTYAWTVVPDKIIQELERMGYDGIKDSGGKNNSKKHDVWIAFHPWQAKSSMGNSGEFSPEDNRMTAKSVSWYKRGAYAPETYNLKRYLEYGIDVFDYPQFVTEFLWITELLEEGEGDECEFGINWLEKASQEDRDNYKKWLVDNDKQFENGDSFVPAYTALDYSSFERADWLVHFTDAPHNIASEGFTKGYDDFNGLHLTTHFKNKGPGYNFAFERGTRDAISAANDGKYGKGAVVFYSSAVKAFHDGDEETQMIFWGPGVKANMIIPICQEDGEWMFEDGNRTYKQGGFDEVVDWVVDNFPMVQKIYHGKFRAKKQYSNNSHWYRVADEAVDDIWRTPREEYEDRPDFDLLKEQYPDTWFDSPEINRSKQLGKEWEASVKKAMTFGEISQEDAEKLGRLGMNGGDKMELLPEILYHVTTVKDVIFQEGLKTRDDIGGTYTGLGGGTSDTISFTTNIQLASDIKKSLLEVGQIGRQEITLQSMIEMAANGEGADKPYLSRFLDSWKRNDKEPWKEGDPYPQAIDQVLRGVESSAYALEPKTKKQIEELGGTSVGEHYIDGAGQVRYFNHELPLDRSKLIEITMGMFKWWLQVRQEAGGPENPLFWLTDAEKVGFLSPDQVAILQFRPVQNAHGYQLGGLREWRIFYGDAVELVGEITEDISSVESTSTGGYKVAQISMAMRNYSDNIHSFSLEPKYEFVFMQDNLFRGYTIATFNILGESNTGSTVSIDQSEYTPDNISNFEEAEIEIGKRKGNGKFLVYWKEDEDKLRAESVANNKKWYRLAANGWWKKTRKEQEEQIKEENKTFYDDFKNAWDMTIGERVDGTDIESLVAKRKESTLSWISNYAGVEECRERGGCLMAVDQNWYKMAQGYEIPNEGYLYHATFEHNMESIVQNGLGAGCFYVDKYGNNSCQDSVYLASDEHVAYSYAELLADDGSLGDPEEMLDSIIVFRVDISGLDPSKFNVDPNIKIDEGDVSSTILYLGSIPPEALELINTKNENDLFVDEKNTNWHKTAEQRWGKWGSGILFVCFEDNTYLSALRSEHVEQPGTWGIPGGAVKGSEGFYDSEHGEATLPSDEDFFESAKRETEEEFGVLPSIEKVLGSSDYVKGDFVYKTFVCSISLSAKNNWKPEMNWENDEFAWFSIGEMPENSHFGLEYTMKKTDNLADYQNSLGQVLEKLKPRLALAVQEAYDEWEQDENGIDEELGEGGICQDVASKMSEVLVYNGIDSMEVDNNGMGDQHVWVTVYDKREAFSVDVSPYVYETGGGYSWRKIKDVKISVEDIEIYPLAKDIVKELNEEELNEEELNEEELNEEELSGKISSLIVAVVPDEKAYILEGCHRLNALDELGVASFPALVVADTEEIDNTMAKSKTWYKKADGFFLYRYIGLQEHYAGHKIPLFNIVDKVGNDRSSIALTYSQFMAYKNRIKDHDVASSDIAESESKGVPVKWKEEGKEEGKEVAANSSWGRMAATDFAKREIYEVGFFGLKKEASFHEGIKNIRKAYKDNIYDDLVEMHKLEYFISKIKNYKKDSKLSGGRLPSRSYILLPQLEENLDIITNTIINDMLPVFIDWDSIHSNIDSWACNFAANISYNKGVISNGSYYIDIREDVSLAIEEKLKGTADWEESRKQVWVNRNIESFIDDPKNKNYVEEFLDKNPEVRKGWLEKGVHYDGIGEYIEAYYYSDFEDFLLYEANIPYPNKDFEISLEDVYDDEWWDHLVASGDIYCEGTNEDTYYEGKMGPFFNTFIEVLKTKGYDLWKENFPGIEDNERAVSESIDRMQSASTPIDKTVAISLALNVEHYFGTMSKHVGLSDEEFENLDHLNHLPWDEELKRFGIIFPEARNIGWYKFSYDDDENNNEYDSVVFDFSEEKYRDVKVPGIELLKQEAIKYNSLDEFRRAFMGDIKHGIYWHITEDPDFTIDPNKGPRDMSSMSNGNNVDVGKLMITSHLEYWVEGYFDTRKYAALIDMSQVNKEDYRQVNRGFGNEFFVKNTDNVIVSGVYPIDEALYIDEQYKEVLPFNFEELEQIYNQAHEERSGEKYSNNKNSWYKLSSYSKIFDDIQKKNEYGEFEDENDIIKFMNDNNIKFEKINFKNAPVFVFEDGYNKFVVDLENQETKEAEEWVDSIDDYYLHEYVGLPKEEDFWEDVGSGFVLYHATTEENAESIKKNGIECRNESRGISNRGIGCSVFTSPNVDSIASYGDYIFEIDIGAMKRDGYTPPVESETGMEEASLRSSIAWKLGLDDYFVETEQGLDPDTVIINGGISAKYIELVGHKEGKSLALCVNDRYRMAQQEKVLYIMRGISGSGKSTLADQLVSDGVKLATDDYWGPDYNFDSTKMTEAHIWNQQRAQKEMMEGTSPVVIDNTNIRAWEAKEYVKNGIRYGYKIEIVEPETEWKFNPTELSQRNTHDVPMEVIEEMVNDYEHDITVDDIINSKAPWEERQERKGKSGGSWYRTSDFDWDKDYVGKCDFCGKCCTEVSINSPLPDGTLFVKPAGVECQYLKDKMCSVWGDKSKQPDVCRDIMPFNSLCRFDLRGEKDGDRLHTEWLRDLENKTSPQANIKKEWYKMAANDMTIPPEYIAITEDINQKAASVGLRAYAVGGFVRDLVGTGMGKFSKTPKDLDIMVNVTDLQLYEQAIASNNILASIPREKIVPSLVFAQQYYGDIGKPQVGANFGIYLVDFRHMGLDEPVEVASPREEVYGETRKPEIVVTNDISKDANRRDFGMNALFLDLSDNSILDYTGHGMQDLREGVIRVAGTIIPTEEDEMNPEKLDQIKRANGEHIGSILKDDPLRILRMLRLSQSLRKNTCNLCGADAPLE